MNGLPVSRRNRRLLLLLGLAPLCLLLGGCFETRQDITLNPDGTGRAIIESTFAPLDPLLQTTGQRTTATPGRQALRDLIDKATGVDAWRELSWRELEDGRVTVRGIAYFTNLSTFSTPFTAFQRFQAKRDPQGGLRIEVGTDATRASIARPGAPGQPSVTAESLLRERQQWRALQPWLTATLGNLQQETILHLPGPVRESSNFDTNTPGTLRLHLAGPRLLAAIDDAVSDPERAGRLHDGDPAQGFDRERANERIYGRRAPVQAVIQPTGPVRFDYASEVAAARKSFPELARSLGLSERDIPGSAPAIDGTPATLTVLGMGWRFDSADRARSPFASERPGYTLHLRADLPGAVLKIRRITVTEARTMEGTSLNPEPTVAPQFAGGREARTQTSVEFNLRLASPPRDCAGLAEVSGFLECDRLENLRTVELLSGRLQNGARGTHFGAGIEFIGPHIGGGGKLILHSQLPPEQLAAVSLVNDAGQTITLERRGSMKVGPAYSYTFIATRELPRTGRVQADVLVDANIVRIPFAVTNLSLLGQPLAAR